MCGVRACGGVCVDICVGARCELAELGEAKRGRYAAQEEGWKFP